MVVYLHGDRTGRRPMPWHNITNALYRQNTQTEWKEQKKSPKQMITKGK